MKSMPTTFSLSLDPALKMFIAVLSFIIFSGMNAQSEESGISISIKPTVFLVE